MVVKKLIAQRDIKYTMFVYLYFQTMHIYYLWMQTTQYIVKEYNQNSGYVRRRRVRDGIRYGYKWACFL